MDRRSFLIVRNNKKDRECLMRSHLHSLVEYRFFINQETFDIGSSLMLTNTGITLKQQPQLSIKNKIIPFEGYFSNYPKSTYRAVLNHALKGMNPFLVSCPSN